MKKLLLVSCASLLLSSCSHHSCHKKSLTNEHAIQNTAEATRYFEKELNFTTNPYGVKIAIDKGHHVVIVDVRKAEDYKAGHIPGAVNLPFDKWDSFQGNQSEFPHLKKGELNYIYCYEALCNLGQKAAKKFASLGYPVKEVKGGYKSWKEHKYPVAK